MAIRSEVLLRITGDGSDAEAALESVRDRLQSLSSVALGVGSALTKFVTLPLSGLVTGAFFAAAGFEQAMTGVAKTVELTQAELQALGDEFQRLAEDELRGFSASDLAGIAELGGQLGIAKENLTDFVRLIAGLDISTDLGAEQAALELAQFANIMQTADRDLSRIGSTIVELGNRTATTESRILAMAQRIARGGAAAGLAETDVLGFAAAVASVGVEAEAGGTAISRVFQEVAIAVSEGGDRLDAIAAIAGQTAAEFRRSFEQNAAGAIVTFIEGLGRAQKAGINVFQVLESAEFTSLRVREALLGVAGAGSQLRDALDLASVAWDENTALTEEASKFYATLGNDFKSLLQEVKNLAADLGELLAPAFRFVFESIRAVLDVLRAGLELFAALPRWVKLLASLLLGLAIAAGPLISALGVLAGIMATLATPAGAGAIAALVVQLGLLAPWIAVGGVIVVGLAAVTAGFIAWRKATKAQEQALAEFRASLTNVRADLTDLGAVRAEIADKETQFARNLSEIAQKNALIENDRIAERLKGSYQRRVDELRRQNAALGTSLGVLRNALGGVAEGGAEGEDALSDFEAALKRLRDSLLGTGTAAAEAAEEFDPLAEQMERLVEAQRELAAARTDLIFANTETAAVALRERIRKLREEIASLRSETLLARGAEQVRTRGAFEPDFEVLQQPEPVTIDLEEPTQQVEQMISLGDRLRLSLAGAFRAASDEGAVFAQVLADIVSGVLQDFGAAIEGAFVAVVQGTKSAGAAFRDAMLGALAAVARGFGQFFLARAAGAIASGLLGHPGGFAGAAKFTAAAALMFALAGSIGGALAGGGAAGGGSTTSTFEEAGDAAGKRRSATVIFEGEPFLDMSNPRTRERFGEMIRELGDLDNLTIRFA